MKKTLPAWIVLTVIAVVAALALAFTHDSTKDRIAEIEAEKAVAVRQSLLPDAAAFNKVAGVDAIAGATITSEAVLAAFNEAYAQLDGPDDLEVVLRHQIIDGGHASDGGVLYR